MPIDAETRAILDNQGREIHEIKTVLTEISKAVTAFVQYETRQDVVENNLSDHESRIRAIEKHGTESHESRIKGIEKYAWLLGLIGTMFTGIAGKLSYDAVSIIDEARQQRPMSAEQYTEATKKAFIEALKDNDTDSHN